MPAYGQSVYPGAFPGMPSTVPGGYAQPIEAGFNSLAVQPGCDCNMGLGGVMPQMPYGDGIPRLGSPYMPDDYPRIQSPNVPSTMPPGFENPAQPRPAPNIELERGNTSRRGAAIPSDMPSLTDRTRGAVEVKLPIGAKLFVEGRELQVTNGQRTFVTPPLPHDKEGVYRFKVEMDVDGDTVAHTKKVHVRAGATTHVEFAELLASHQAKPGIVPTPLDTLPEVPTMPNTDNQHNATSTTHVKPTQQTSQQQSSVPTVKAPPKIDYASILVTLPEGADLYVNGTKNERTERVREFTTPRLADGKNYQYIMKAQIVRNGLPEYQEQKIDFKAGDSIRLDFTNLVEREDTKHASR